MTKFTLNGENVEFKGDDSRRLLWVLRSDFSKTGTKYGCGMAQCGSCTVLVDGEAVLSCITPIKRVAGKTVRTVEGLAQKKLHPLQEAFMKVDALQCGFCTPGMLMKAAALLKQNPDPTRQEIVEGMEGNLCRCGAYGRIIEAIQIAAKKMRGAS